MDKIELNLNRELIVKSIIRKKISYVALISIALIVLGIVATVFAQAEREPGRFYYDKLSIGSDDKPEYQYSDSNGNALYFDRKLTVKELYGLPDILPKGYLRGYLDDEPSATKRLEDLDMTTPGFSQVRTIGFAPAPRGGGCRGGVAGRPSGGATVYHRKKGGCGRR